MAKSRSDSLRRVTGEDFHSGLSAVNGIGVCLDDLTPFTGPLFMLVR